MPPAGISFTNLSMSGVTAFMSRIAYIIPSGYSPTILMSIMRAPVPIPKIHMPFLVSGAVTGSVAIKNAHSSMPPLDKWTSGDAYAAGFKT